MKLENEFTVPVPLDEAWKVLLDVERVAPCMPGATLLSIDGDSFTGTVKVKVGPIQVTYKGSATFTTRDESAHRAVIEASGKESRGSGTAAATVTTVLAATGDSATKVSVETDLNVTGRPAQFGRGVMAEVAGKLVGQFATCLAEELAGGGAAATSPAEPAAPREATQPPTTTQPLETGEASAPTAPAAAPTASVPQPPTPAPRRSAEAIDLLDVAGASVAKRAAPVAAVVALLLLILWWRRRH